MSDKKISQLTAATTPLAGTEVLPIVQSGATVKVPVSSLTAGRAVAMLSSSVGPNAIALSGAVIDVGFDRNSPTRLGVSNQNSGASAVAGIDFEAAGGGWQLDVPPDVSTFANPLIGKFNGTEKFRFKADGSLAPIAGAGIDFSADGQAAGMTSELLDDYEEGTWTPTDASGGGLTLTINYAKYVKIGKQVTVNAFISYPANASALDAVIGGFPFTVEANNYPPALLITNSAVTAGVFFNAATTTGGIVDPASYGTKRSNLQMSGVNILLSATYFV